MGENTCMGGHPFYRQLQAIKNLVVLKWFFAWICKEVLTWFCFCLRSSTSRLGKLKSRATNQDQWWPLHQRFRGVRDALPRCSFTTISDFPPAFFACFAQHYSIFAFTDHLFRYTLHSRPWCSGFSFAERGAYESLKSPALEVRHDKNPDSLYLFTCDTYRSRGRNKRTKQKYLCV